MVGLEMILSMIIISRKPMQPPELLYAALCSVHTPLFLLALSFHSTTPEGKITITVSVGRRSEVNPAYKTCCDDHAEVCIIRY